MAKILIIDDADETRTLVGRFLQAKGYEVVQAADGNEGLERAAQDRPDLILMDLNMPHMTGFEATGLLKNNSDLRHIPVLALSAETGTGNRDAIYEAGCDGFLAKPIDFPDLLQTIGKHLPR